MGTCGGVDEVFYVPHMITPLGRGQKISKSSGQKYRFSGNPTNVLGTPNNLYKPSRLPVLAFLYSEIWPREKVTHWPYRGVPLIRPTFYKANTPYKANFVVLNLTGLIEVLTVDENHTEMKTNTKEIMYKHKLT